MQLHGHSLSANTHKVRLALAVLGQRYDEIVVDISAAAHKSPAFLAKNPRGQLPVLVDGDITLYDAQAILVYLAIRYDPKRTWFPDDAVGAARVTAWLSFAANELHNGVHQSRIHKLLGAPVPVDHAVATARASLALLEAHLRDRPFLELGRPTIADLACMPLVALAPEGGIDLAPYPNVQRWVAALDAIPEIAAREVRA
jgi:glutathione S-transferase